MLRQFHFIDQNGKDQGINVRNRAKELAELLGDVDRIRTERKKARSNRNKFGGVEGGMGMGGGGGFAGTGNRYGGFGSESAQYGGSSSGVYGDGGGFGGEDPTFTETQQRRERFEEYDEYDEGDNVASPPRRREPTSTSTRREPKKAEPPKPKAPEPVPDLLAWDDEPAPAASSSAGKAPAAPAASNDFGEDDDFDDFQSAAPAPAPAAAKPAGFGIAPPASTSTISSTTQFAAPQPQSAVQNNNFNDLFATVSPAPSANRMMSPPAQPASMSSGFSQPPKPTGYQASGPNYFTSVPQPVPQSSVSTPGSVKSPGGIGGGANKKAGGDAFASLLGGVSSKKAQTPTQKVTMGDLAKQKTSQGLWGTPASNSSTPAAQSPQAASKPAGGALGDLLG